jgi:hypothetical protein
MLRTLGAAGNDGRGACAENAAIPVTVRNNSDIDFHLLIRYPAAVIH